MRNLPTFKAGDRHAGHGPGAAEADLGLVIVSSPIAAALGRIIDVDDVFILKRVGDAHDEDDWMSREHATVRALDGKLFVRDGTTVGRGEVKRSANGTYVGDTLLGADEVEVQAGDVIRTGRTLWMVVRGPQGAAAGTLLVGCSEAVGRARDEIALVVRQVAMRLEQGKRVSQALLVTGPRGSGKQVVALEAHRQLSQLRKGVGGAGATPFVQVPAPALSDGTAAADLFGVVDKYATDVKARPGYFEMSQNGVLLFDEIGDAPPAEQAKLLNVLEERQVTRLGGRTPVSFDCLVVAATNRDLDAMAESDQFRSDLVDRLARFRVHLPPLAERTEDILPIAHALLARHGHTRPLAWDVALKLLRSPWPGNVRELDAFLERMLAIVHTQGSEGPDLDTFERAARVLRPRATQPGNPGQTGPILLAAASGAGPTTGTTTRPVGEPTRGQCPPREELEKKLVMAQWNKTEVGRMYGKDPRQITRWMEYLGIVKPEGS